MRAVLASLWEGMPPLTPAAQAIVTREQAYFMYHADRIDYPRYRATGLPIGFGRVESASEPPHG